METSEDLGFYYLKRSEGKQIKPYGVVAVRMNCDGTVNRGISICSPNDEFRKKVGRGIAYSRLIKAETACHNVGKFEVYNGTDDKKLIRLEDIPFEYHGEFNQKPSETEYRMFHKPGE